MPGLTQALGHTGIPDIGQALKPENLAQGFTQGMQSGGPLAQGSEALGNAISQGAQSFNAQNLAHPPLAYQPEFSTPTGTLSASTAPSSGGYPEAGPAPSVAPITAAAPPITAPAPIAAAGAPAAAPMAPAGPLPAYGSDLRPATPTITPVPPAPLGAPTSAAVTPSSAGPGGLTQPAVVNKAPAAPSSQAPSSPVGLTETASAAAASGAAAGAIATDSADKARLRRLVESVARQQPKLRWAAADLEDGTTLLVTDLASGWIPPDVEIPTGVHVLTPEHRSGGLEKLLRNAVRIETWTPGQYLPEPDTDPVTMSLRARDLPAIDDLNWELTQATNWRDGLPRLAHTLTKAAIAGTGVLDAEADLLHQHLHTTAAQVLNAYPDGSTETVGNWQLLAAIDALINGHRTALKYHFAWFQALSTTKHGV